MTIRGVTAAYGIAGYQTQSEGSLFNIILNGSYYSPSLIRIDKTLDLNGHVMVTVESQIIGYSYDDIAPHIGHALQIFMTNIGANTVEQELAAVNLDSIEDMLISGVNAGVKLTGSLRSASPANEKWRVIDNVMYLSHSVEGYRARTKIRADVNPGDRIFWDGIDLGVRDTVISYSSNSLAFMEVSGG